MKIWEFFHLLGAICRHTHLIANMPVKLDFNATLVKNIKHLSDFVNDNGWYTLILRVRGVLFLFLATWMKFPPTLYSFKAFPSYLLQTWCTWSVSQPPPPDTLCSSHFVHPPSNKGNLLSKPLLQQASDWLLFLDIFGGRRGLEYLVLPVFTHT